MNPSEATINKMGFFKNEKNRIFSFKIFPLNPVRATSATDPAMPFSHEKKDLDSGKETSDIE